MNIDKYIEALDGEVAELRRLVANVEANATTPFHGWRVRDSIGHMVTIDRLATLAMADPDAFAIELVAFGDAIRPDRADVARHDSFRRIARYEDGRLCALSWESLLAEWAAGVTALGAAAGRLRGEDRVPWFGGSMKVESLLAARHMEVWAYGQDIFDAVRAVRLEGDRIRNVVEFGLKTLGFSFANRGEAAPDIKPHVALRSPSGALWQWNDPQSPDHIVGDAVDFCLVVTQRRHVGDTKLEVAGAAAARWMRIAQCIAGPPVDGPDRGERAW